MVLKKNFQRDSQYPSALAKEYFPKIKRALHLLKSMVDLHLEISERALSIFLQKRSKTFCPEVQLA